MTQRRNPFDTTLPIQQPVSQPLYDNLRLAEKPIRSRQWEKEHQSSKATYRGVDPKIALQVKQAAGDLGVPVGEVARAMLEYALRAYASNDLDLNPRPNPNGMRMTLYPNAEQRCARNGVRARRKKTESQAGWRVIVTWRGLPPGLKGEIADLASEDGLNVPVGELVTALLRFSLKAYEYGLLKLEPVEETSGNSLDGGDL